MKKWFYYLAVLMSVAITLSACETAPVPEDFNPQAETQGHNNDRMKFNSSDRKVAVDVDGKKSDRKNASGPKITSNSHCNDFPGLLFIWDKKHKDCGYLKVQSGVFDKYESFTLTTKESNKYYDFEIELQKNQRKTSDNCYVFFVEMNKCHGKGKINMVFISKFCEKKDKCCDCDCEKCRAGKCGGKCGGDRDKDCDRDRDCDKDRDRDCDRDKNHHGKDCDKGHGKDCDRDRDCDKGRDKDCDRDRDCDKDRDCKCTCGCGCDDEEEPVTPPVEPEPTDYVVALLSGRDFGTPVTSTNVDAGNISFQNYWDEGIGRSYYAFDAIATAADREPAVWAWDVANSLATGQTGDTVEYELTFEIKGDVITDQQLVFAGDNAVAVWINGELAGSTSATYLVGDEVTTGNAYWDSVYVGSPKVLPALFHLGTNTVKIVARNAANATLYPNADPYNTDPAKGEYDTTNNAAGILFALLVKSERLQ